LPATSVWRTNTVLLPTTGVKLADQDAPLGLYSPVAPDSTPPGVNVEAAAPLAYRAAIVRTTRLRDSVAVEVALLVGVLASLFAAETYVGGDSLLTWSTLPARIAFRFLVLRWIWRWVLWGVFLWRVSRLRLVLRATHPDRLAGIGALLGPSYAFCAVIAACAAALAAGWVDVMRHAHLPLSAFYPMALTYAFIAALLALLPTCVFTAVLYRVRKEGMASFGAFSHRFVQAFEERWHDASGKDALGAPDISSLADLGGSYVALTEMRVIPWTGRLVHTVVLGSILPMVPVVCLELGIPAIIQRLWKMML